MAHYRLDDPALQAELDRLAAEEAAAWPVTDETLAALARILPTANAMADRRNAAIAPAIPAQRRRAA
ncbi:hypothetical protein [Verrucosispora sp. NA02020]|uniref:hypothetical protein n=1 Tax=Verrucosispora sp. NA02020 TaxID=2742132 RepID=UPI00159168CF|nr:hypothetical protein [Verrucosispora sp. NA02020]QKW15307.1 hypothetical protein HUT12_22810 [Verrucosispora sp. NA02020]